MPSVASIGRRTSVTPEVLRALADPIRRHMLERLSGHPELTSSDLEATLPISGPTISYHTKILVQAGLITSRTPGRTVVYSLRRAVLRDLVGELGTLLPALHGLDSPPTC